MDELRDENESFEDFMTGHRLRNADSVEFKVKDSQAKHHKQETSFDLDNSMISMA